MSRITIKQVANLLPAFSNTTVLSFKAIEDFQNIISSDLKNSETVTSLLTHGDQLNIPYNLESFNYCCLKSFNFQVFKAWCYSLDIHDYSSEALKNSRHNKGVIYVCVNINLNTFIYDNPTITIINGAHHYVKISAMCKVRRTKSYTCILLTSPTSSRQVYILANNSGYVTDLNTFISQYTFSSSYYMLLTNPEFIESSYQLQIKKFSYETMNSIKHTDVNLSKVDSYCISKISLGESSNHPDSPCVNIPSEDVIDVYNNKFIIAVIEDGSVVSLCKNEKT
jgi:hypothetical protein